MNITDLDDNTIQESIKRGIPLKELTDQYTAEFMKCLDQLDVKHAWKYPRTSEHVDDMAGPAPDLVAEERKERRADG